MKALKILIVSPCGTHPSHEGNRQRILTLAEGLRRQGFDVHLAVAPNGKFQVGDVRAMRLAWSHRLHLLYPATAWTWGYRLRRLAARWLVPWLIPRDIVGVSDRVDTVDDFFLDWWIIQLIMLQRQHRFDAVMCEYVFVSRALLAFGPHVSRVIDTHDVFSGRDEALHRTRGIATKWLSTSPEAESTALNRAAVVIGISEDDSEHFRTLTRASVVTVGHLLPVADRSDDGIDINSALVLFVGSDNVINADGCLWFIREVLPAVRRRLPAAKLRVVGGVARRVAAAGLELEGVQLAGPVDDLGSEYARAAAVVNPVLFGSGLAIKSIEALAHGKALVCTEVGARGIVVHGQSAPCAVVRDAAGFAEALATVLSDEAVRRRMEAAAADFCAAWSAQQFANLLSIFEAPSVVAADQAHF